MRALELLLFLIPGTVAAGQDNQLITIIAVTGAVAGTVIVIAIIIACIYYARTVKTIKERAKKQILNNSQKRNIYRPDIISLDSFFKAHEFDENRSFFSDEISESIYNPEVRLREVDYDVEASAFESEGTLSTTLERQMSLESLQIPLVKQLYNEQEMKEIEEMDETMYGDLEDWENINETTEDEEVHRDKKLSHRDHKRISTKRKQWSLKFLKAPKPKVPEGQQRNYDRWKLLTLFRGAKSRHSSRKRNIKSVTVGHKKYGYFRRALRSKVTSLQSLEGVNNQVRRIKVKAINNADLLEDDVNEKPESEEPETLISAANKTGMSVQLLRTSEEIEMYNYTNVDINKTNMREENVDNMETENEKTDPREVIEDDVETEEDKIISREENVCYTETEKDKANSREENVDVIETEKEDNVSNASQEQRGEAEEIDVMNPSRNTWNSYVIIDTKKNENEVVTPEVQDEIKSTKPKHLINKHGSKGKRKGTSILKMTQKNKFGPNKKRK